MHRQHSHTKQNNRTALHAQVRCLWATGLNDSRHLQIRMKGSHSFQKGQHCWIAQKHWNICVGPWSGLSKTRGQPCPSFLPGSRCLVICLWHMESVLLWLHPHREPCQHLPGSDLVCAWVPPLCLFQLVSTCLAPPLTCLAPPLVCPATPPPPASSPSAQTQEAAAGQCALFWCSLSWTSLTFSPSCSLSLCSTLFFLLPPLRPSPLLVSLGWDFWDRLLRLIYRTCVQMTHGCKQISRACSSVVGAKWFWVILSSPQCVMEPLHVPTLKWGCWPSGQWR